MVAKHLLEQNRRVHVRSVHVLCTALDLLGSTPSLGRAWPSGLTWQNCNAPSSDPCALPCKMDIPVFGDTKRRSQCCCSAGSLSSTFNVRVPSRHPGCRLQNADESRCPRAPSLNLTSPLTLADSCLCTAPAGHLCDRQEFSIDPCDQLYADTRPRHPSNSVYAWAARLRSLQATLIMIGTAAVSASHYCNG